jgi:hypothetical protein
VVACGLRPWSDSPSRVLRRARRLDVELVLSLKAPVLLRGRRRRYVTWFTGTSIIFIALASPVLLSMKLSHEQVRNRLHSTIFGLCGLQPGSVWLPGLAPSRRRSQNRAGLQGLLDPFYFAMTLTTGCEIAFTILLVQLLRWDAKCAHRIIISVHLAAFAHPMTRPPRRGRTLRVSRGRWQASEPAPQA